MSRVSSYEFVASARTSRIVRAIGGVALWILAFGQAGVLAAQGSSLSLDKELTFSSAYVWRGITFTDGGVFQPSITAAHTSGFSLNTWGNLDVSNANGLSGDFQEVDLTVAYGFGSDAVSAEVGLIDYLFPNGVGEETREVYFSLGFDVPLQPSVALYYDFDLVEGYYGTVSVEHGSELAENWSYSVGLLAGFASEEFATLAAGGADGGLFNGQLTFRVDRALSWGSVGAFVAYTDSLDEDVLPEQEVDLFGGLSFSLSF